jgi:hypothetical protein
MLMARPLMIGVDVRALLRHLRLASSARGEWTVASRFNSACCVPAFNKTASDGFSSLNVMRYKTLHSERSMFLSTRRRPGSARQVWKQNNNSERNAPFTFLGTLDGFAPQDKATGSAPRNRVRGCAPVNTAKDSRW